MDEHKIYLGNISTRECIGEICRGKPDDYHKHNQGIISYINCFQERLLHNYINTDKCNDDNFWNIYKLPYNGQCTK